MQPDLVQTQLGAPVGPGQTRRPSVLPLTRDAQTGELQLALPRLLDLLGNATPSAVGSTAARALGAAPVARAADEMVLGAGPIKAYHGSPHNFDKFDMSRIGTGEGAQSYGHGLYFAEKEGVARAYRDALSRQPSPADDVARYWLQQGGNDRARAASLFRSHAISTGLKPAEIAETAALIEKPAGRMYEVAIHADPERFLDWDKPLSGQSERVRKGFGSIVDRDLSQERGWAALTGQRALGAAVERAGIRGGGEAALREAGIPGIKYLDQGSRIKGEGSRNYVTFSDDLVEILRKYGLAGLAMLPPIYGAAGPARERAVAP